MGTITKQPKKVPELRFPAFNEQWNLTTLGETGSVVNGLTYSPDNIDESGVLVLRSSNVQEGRLAFNDTVHVNVAEGHYNPVEVNDILICVRNGSKRLIGKNAIIPEEAAGTAFGAFMSVYRSDLNTLLFQWFSTDNYKKQVHQNLGATINSINGNDLRKFRLRIPTDSEEQQKIADFLGSVDAWLGNLRSQKTALETYKAGCMQKLFTQQVRFKDDNGNNFPEWEECSFEEILASVSIRGHQVNRDDFLDSGKFPVVDQGKDFIAGYTNDNDVVLDDVPVIVFGDHTTIMKYVDFKFAAGADGTKVLRGKRGDSLKLLYYLMLANPLEAEGYKRHFSILRQKNYLLPTSNAEQQKIADFLTAIDHTITAKAEEITQVEQWKKGLMQKMFV